mmetsp:Transcript_50795/g.162557  ORF Transcript_50795/g.162557 Transcript_50795/m.162557 type:complete len:139 (-) Transcript_50795:13-429(-)
MLIHNTWRILAAGAGDPYPAATLAAPRGGLFVIGLGDLADLLLGGAGAFASPGGFAGLGFGNSGCYDFLDWFTGHACGFFGGDAACCCVLLTDFNHGLHCVKAGAARLRPSLGSPEPRLRQSRRRRLPLGTPSSGLAG